MKNSKLLNRRHLSIILFSLFVEFDSQSQEPIDIWNTETKSISRDSSNIEKNGD